MRDRRDGAVGRRAAFGADAPAVSLTQEVPLSIRPAWIRAVALSVCASAGVSVAHAQSEEAQTEPVRVASVRFEGVERLEEAAIRAVMQTEAPSLLTKLVPFSKAPLYEAATLREDVPRIEAYYSARGFPDAQVTRVVADVDDAERTVDIVVTIAEGAPQLAGRVSFEGFDDVEPARLERLPDLAGYAVGEPLDVEWVDRIRDDARFVLRDLGHARAVVEVRETEAENGGVDLTFVARPGPLMRIGEIEIDGHAWAKAWAYPGTTFHGSVQSIAPVAEDGRYGKVVRVNMLVEDADGLLKSGMTGNAKVQGDWHLLIVVFTRALARFVLVEVWSWLP